MDVDVKALMLRLLDTQKTYVCEDLENYSCAMVAVFDDYGRSYIQFPKFDDETSKIAEYAEIVRTAKVNNAALIVTVNHAKTRTNISPEDLELYQWGDFGAHNSQPCILLTASGPGLSPCSLELIYEIVNDQVRFGEAGWLAKAELNLLPEWPDSPPMTIV